VSGDEILKPGKLPGAFLNHLLQTYIKPDPSVLIGPEVGADAAAIAVGNRVIVVKSDPITFPTPDIAGYLVNVNANDITCMGAIPRWLLVTALLPEGSATADMVEGYFRDLAAACGALGIALVGGHTEVTVGLDRPLMVGLMIGETQRERLLDLRTARPGDVVLLFNGVAIEGTAILANEAHPNDLRAVPDATLARARAFTRDPGISVLPAASALHDSGAQIRGMHDPTEGGIATAIHELARVTGMQVRLDGDSIPVFEETKAICDALGLNPLGLIASGALLTVISADTAKTSLDYLRDQGLEVAAIGTLHASVPDAPRVVDDSGDALPEFSTDEIARYFAAHEAGDRG
jgi:hydrogenase maturation factor